MPAIKTVLLNIAVVLASCSIPHFGFAERLVFGYSQHNQAGLVPNILTRVECIFAHVGHEVEFTELPAARISSLLRNGRLDGDVARVSTFLNDSDPAVKIPTPVAEVNVWVYAKKNLNIKSLSDLIRYKMIPILGVAYFNRYDPKIYARGDEVRSVPLALKMVLGGRGDYTFGTDETWEEVVRRGWDADIQRYPADPLEKIRLYTLLHDRHASKLETLDAAVKKVHSGEICHSS